MAAEPGFRETVLWVKRASELERGLALMDPAWWTWWLRSGQPHQAAIDRLPPSAMPPIPEK
jgi:hypothetical protein